MPSDDDKVAVVIGGIQYQDWHEVDLDSDLFTPADAFSVRASIPSKDIRANFREGAKCDIYIGRDRQMAGVIDDVGYSGDRMVDRMTITGRDKGAYLVDCEAHRIKVEQQKIETLVKRLLDPSFGIKGPVFSNAENRDVLFGKKDKKKPRAKAVSVFTPIPRSRTKVDPGQKIASIIDAHCHRLGITWWLQADGTLFLGKPNYDQEAAYKFVVYDFGSASAKDNNVESWSVARTMADRYSEVEVAGSGMPSPSEFFTTAKPAPKFKATAKDQDLVNRGIVRKTVIADCDITTKDEAQKRANTEIQNRRIRALSINLTVPGFRQGDRLFAIDTVASVKLESADIDGLFYVTQRKFTESVGKQRTHLTLREKGVWLT